MRRFAGPAVGELVCPAPLPRDREATQSFGTPCHRPSHPVLVIIDEVLRDLKESPVAEDWSYRAGDGKVLANGVAVPVRRLSWPKIGPFFEQLYDRSNAALFQRRLPGCRLRWNRRFRSLAGRIQCRERILEISSAHFEACGAVALGVVVVHEQIHLALYESGLPSGHTRQFKHLSGAFGLPKIHHELPLPDRLRRATVHLYRCVCGRVFESRIRFQKPRACSTCCAAHAGGRYDARFRLQYIGTNVQSPGSS